MDIYCHYNNSPSRIINHENLTESKPSKPLGFFTIKTGASIWVYLKMTYTLKRPFVMMMMMMMVMMMVMLNHY